MSKEERTQLGVSEVREHNGTIEVDCWHPCYDEKLTATFPYCQLPKPDAPFEVSHRSATDSKALQSALYVEGLLGNLMNGDKSAIKKMNVEALVVLIQFARDKAGPVNAGKVLQLSNFHVPTPCPVLQPFRWNATEHGWVFWPVDPLCLIVGSVEPWLDKINRYAYENQCVIVEFDTANDKCDLFESFDW